MIALPTTNNLTLHFCHRNHTPSSTKTYPPITTTTTCKLVSISTITTRVFLFPYTFSSQTPTSCFTTHLIAHQQLRRHRFSGSQRNLHTTKVCATAPEVMLHSNPFVSDLIAAVLTSGIAFSFLRLWQETAKRCVFDEKVNRKLVHISIGLVFMLCWPLFSSGHRGALLAALTPGVNIIRMLLIGSGIWKDDATVNSMSRFGDRRELLKGPLYYAITITLACAIYWRTSPIAIAAVCNLCAGDGIADIVGRRFGFRKLPYNRNKTIAGSIAMAVAGFLACLGYMHYFASFGYIQESWEMVLGFLIVSLGSTLVESHPLSTVLDDNLTVTVASVVLGSLVF